MRVLSVNTAVRHGAGLLLVQSGVLPGRLVGVFLRHDVDSMVLDGLGPYRPVACGAGACFRLQSTDLEILVRAKHAWSALAEKCSGTLIGVAVLLAVGARQARPACHVRWRRAACGIIDACSCSQHGLRDDWSGRCAERDGGWRIMDGVLAPEILS